MTKAIMAECLDEASALFGAHDWEELKDEHPGGANATVGLSVVTIATALYAERMRSDAQATRAKYELAFRLAQVQKIQGDLTPAEAGERLAVGATIVTQGVRKA